MVRPSRVCIPGQWHHVRHRAAPGVELIRHDGDAAEWRAWLAATAAQFRLQLHAYVLLPREIRWLGTPKDPLSIAGMMKELARRASRRRGEALWGGRYGCALVEQSADVLAAVASLDFAPVRAGLVADCFDWPHGSARAYAGRSDLSVLTPPAQVWAMGNTPFERERRYQQTILAAWSESFDERLLTATDKQWALGTPAWVEEMESLAGRRLQGARRGRPRIAFNKAPIIG
jgi:putative transposase